MNENAVTVLGSPHFAPEYVQELKSQANVQSVRELSKTPVQVLEVSHVGQLTGYERDGVDLATFTQPRPERGVICFDCDSTLITGEVIEMLAAHAGKESEVAEVTDRAMRGELDFEESLRHRVKTLEGLDASVVEHTAAALELSPGVEETIAVLKSHGFKVAVVSGGFIQVLEPLAAQLELDYVQANTLEIVGGKLTGRVVGKVIDRSAKEEFLRTVAADSGVDMAHTVAVGDGANDIDMVTAAGLGVAYKAKPALADVADAQVSFHMLQVLGLLGIPR